MTKSLSARRHRLAAGAVVGAMTVFSLALPAGNAFAVVTPPTTPATNLTATPGTVNVSAGASVSVSATVAPTNSNAQFYFVITGGPDGDKAVNGPNFADGTCAAPTAAGLVVCTFTSNATSGTDSVIIFTNNDTTLVHNTSDYTAASAVKTGVISVVKSGVSAHLAISPSAISVQANSAVSYTVTDTDSASTAVSGQTLNVEITTNANATTQPLSATGLNVTSMGGGGTNAWKITGTTTATTDASGHVSFSVTSTAPGTVSIRVYDGPTSLVGPPAVTYVPYNGSQNSAQAVQTVALGGDDVATVTLTGTATNYANIGQSAHVVLKNASGTPVAGVLPIGTLAGPNASQPVTCGTTAADGSTDCTFANPQAGIDTLTVFVNKSTNSSNTMDANEARGVFTFTTTTPPVINVAQSTVACTDQIVAPGNQGVLVDAGACVVPIDQKDVVLRATIMNNGAAVVGAIVTFTSSVASASGDSLPSCTTGAAGTCTTTWHVANPTVATRVITAHVGTQQVTATTSVEWRARAFASISILPIANAVLIGGVVSVTSKSVDQFGAGMGGRTIAFSTKALAAPTARNTGSYATGNRLTAADGTATFSFTDGGLALSVAQETVVANDVAAGATAVANSDVYYRANITTATITLDATNTCGGTASYSGAPLALAGPGQMVCARVKDGQGNALPGKVVTFTIVGPGGAVSSATAATNSTGDAQVTVTSTGSGVKSVTASVDGHSATATVTFAQPLANTARNIAVTPVTDATVAVAAGDLKNLRFLVTDRYGNGVPNVAVTFNNAGAGFFFGGTNSATATTNTLGIASVAVTSLSTSFGAATVTASLGDGVTPATQCEDLSGMVNGVATAGVAAGNCSTTAVVQFSQKPTIGGTTFRTGPGSVTITGVVAPSIAVDLLEGGIKVASTTSDATGVYTFLRTIDKTTVYTVNAGGLVSGTFTVTVKFGVRVYLKNRVIGKILITVPTYPHVSNIRVNYYMIVGGTYRYLGHVNTGATGFSGFNVRVLRHKVYTFTARAVAGAGRAGSALAAPRSIRSL